MIQLHSAIPKHKDKKLRAPLRISISVLIAGLLFKIQHWPGANIIIVSSFSAIGILYLVRFIYKPQKKPIDYIKVILVLSWSINGVVTVLHLPYHVIFKLVTPATFLIWVFLEGLSYFNEEKNMTQSKRQYILNGLYSVAVVLTMFGIIFKIMHWPGAVPVLIGGVGLAALSFFADMMLQE